MEGGGFRSFESGKQHSHLLLIPLPTIAALRKEREELNAQQDGNTA